MRSLKNWFVTKKIKIKDCERFEMNDTSSDQVFGGFKEYMPPLYEHEVVLKQITNVTDLFSAQGETIK